MSNRCAVPSLSSSIIITESATIEGSRTRCSKRKNASAVPTGRCDVVSDWAACSAITTAALHRSLGAPAGRNEWSEGELCSGAPIAEPVPRRLVSANFENASRIRDFGSVRIFGHDGVWEQTFGATPPRSLSRVFLLLVLLHEHQCRTYGGHSVANRRVLAAMANGTPSLAARTGSVSAGRPETNQVRCERMNK